jgi:hypothetical protein
MPGARCSRIWVSRDQNWPVPLRYMSSTLRTTRLPPHQLDGLFCTRDNYVATKPIRGRRTRPWRHRVGGCSRPRGRVVLAHPGGSGPARATMGGAVRQPCDRAAEQGSIGGFPGRSGETPALPPAAAIATSRFGVTSRDRVSGRRGGSIQADAHKRLWGVSRSQRRPGRSARLLHEWQQGFHRSCQGKACIPICFTSAVSDSASP